MKNPPGSSGPSPCGPVSKANDTLSPASHKTACISVGHEAASHGTHVTSVRMD
jgi:hypothetical protein